jgi:ribose/xylose/arabinose/galactoside ABC-type transport system permease subunit
LAAIFLVGCYVSPAFLTVDNQRDVLEQVSLNGLLAIGMTLVILTAGIDLSVGSLLSLCSVVAAMLIMPVAAADQITVDAPGLQARIDAWFPNGLTKAHLAAWMATALMSGLVAGAFLSRYMQQRWLPTLGGVAIGLAGLAGIILATRHGFNAWAVLICTPLVGAALGAINGFIIARTGLQPFIVTLAVMILAVGLARLTAGGGGRVHSIVPQEINQTTNEVVIRGAPAEFLAVGQERLITVDRVEGRDGQVRDVKLLPLPGLMMLGAWVVAAFLLHCLPIGRHIYAVGGNEEAARLSGIATGKIKVFVYSASGLLAGLAGLVYAARFRQGSATAGQMSELDAIAAVVIGGTSLMGGRGSIFGTLVGVMIFGYLSNILNLQAVSSETQQILKGVIIILAASMQAGGSRGWLQRLWRKPAGIKGPS